MIKVKSYLMIMKIKNHYKRVYIGSQKQAIDFYLKLGFTPFGDEFIEAEIVHLSMEKALT